MSPKNQRSRAASQKPLPKTIGTKIDRLYQIRDERLALQKRVDALKSQETSIGVALFAELGKRKLEGAKGKLASFTRATKTIFTVSDWGAVNDWSIENDVPEIRQRRLKFETIQERLDNDEYIPGINIDHVPAWSLRKA